jgi:transposase
VLALKAWLAQARVRGRQGDDRRRYPAMNHWEGLARFLDDRRIELDSNMVESAQQSCITVTVLVLLQWISR